MASSVGKAERIHYLDNLRALAMLLGVYLHGALAYAEPARSVWIATNPEGSVAIDASIWWIHLFRMSLFFLLSGYFAKRIMQRKGLQAFLWNRMLRIALPFALFWPFLMVAMTIVFIFAFSYVKDPQGLMQVIVAASRNGEAKSSTPYTTMHLWFLYYLLMFSLVAAVVSGWAGWKCDWLFRRKGWFLFAPLALVPGILGGRASRRGPGVLYSYLVALCLLRSVLLGGLAVGRPRVGIGPIATMVLGHRRGQHPVVRAPLLHAAGAGHYLAQRKRSSTLVC